MDRLFRSNSSISSDLVSLLILKMKKITLLKKLVSLILRNGVFLKLILNSSIKLVGSNLSSILSLVLELMSKHIVDIVFCSSTICMLDSKKSKNIVFSLWGLWEHPKLYGPTPSDTRVPKVHFSAKMTKMPLVNLRLTEGQMKSKPSQNNIFHSFTSNLSFSEIFNNFDQIWPGVDLGGPKNPNFDSAIKTSWNQFHCKYYQILIPMTIRR